MVLVRDAKYGFCDHTAAGSKSSMTGNIMAVGNRFIGYMILDSFL